jgi:DNA-binding FadR family transcriptional regulator
MAAIFDQKLASVVATKIMEDILDRGWPVGEKLGTEPTLLQRYKVSREPLREAVRILEWQGIVRVERGQHGGLVIAAPAVTAVANVMRTYLELADISYDEVREAHVDLQQFGIQSAVERMTPSHANGIRKLVRQPRRGFRSRDQEGLAVSRILEAVVGVAGDPSLSMLEYMLSRLTADFGHQERYPAKEWKLMIAPVWAIVERLALCAADSDLDGALRGLHELRRRVDDTVKRLERYDSRIWNTRSFLLGSFKSAIIADNRAGKAATALVYRITAGIRRDELVPGTTLGAEIELMKKFDVSRAVFREAVRTLEFFGVATVKRGGSGGLTVAVADPAATVATAVRYLQYLRSDTTQLRTLLAYLEGNAMRLAAARATHTELMSLISTARIASRASIADTRTLVEQAKRQLMSLTENRALELIVTVLASGVARSGHRPQSMPIPARRRDKLESACHTVELAAAGRSTQNLTNALSGICATLNELTSSPT